MRIVKSADMLDEPEGTIYCETDGSDVTPISDFFGYSDSLYRKGPWDPELGWWKTELLPQPLATGEIDGMRRLRVRTDMFTWRPVDEGDHMYVFDPEDVALLVAALTGGK